MSQNSEDTGTAYRLALASWLCVPPGIYAAVAPFTQLLPSHAFDQTWPVHARFHLTWAASKLFAIGINQILLAVFPLRAGQRWSWFALLVNLLFGGAVIIPASRFQHAPAAKYPFHKHDLATKTAVVSMLSTLLGLIIAFRPLFLTQSQRAPRTQSE